jgi:hypothetical protein
MPKNGDGDDDEYDSNDHADEESDSCNDKACNDDNNDEDVDDDDDHFDRAMAIAMMNMVVMEMATVMVMMIRLMAMVQETWPLFSISVATPSAPHLSVCAIPQDHGECKCKSTQTPRHRDALTPKLKHKCIIIQIL